MRDERRFRAIALLLLVAMSGAACAPSSAEPSVSARPTLGPKHAFSTIQFSSATKGWVALKDSLYGTTNGGATWQRTYLAGSNILGLAFVSNDRGWLLQEPGTGSSYESLVTTTNGGQTWTPTPVRTFAGAGNIRGPVVQMLDATRGYGIEAQAHRLVATQDGGHSWDVQLGAPGQLGALAFWSAELGWVVDQNGRVYKTTDGAHWDYQWQPPLPPGQRWRQGVIARMWLASERDAWLMLDVGSGCASQKAYLVYVTHDGGDHWQLALAQPGACLAADTLPLAQTAAGFGMPGYPSSVAATTPDEAYFFVMSPAGNFTQTQATSDGGRTWTARHGARATNHQVDADFISPDVGWMATDG
ncbi:MAG TPA: hypothetical protein VK457_05265, partial [Chloroflexota bacterium]|nr:hypothetical protein [Chloroflexota bacterium]